MSTATTFAEMLKKWRKSTAKTLGVHPEHPTLIVCRYPEVECADEAQPIYDALRKLHKSGCHDGTCSSALICGMACDCWKSRLAAILGEEQ